MILSGCVLTYIIVYLVTISVAEYKNVDGSASGDMFANSLRGAVESIFEALDKGGCSFRCTNGADPVPKHNHKSTANGCGSFGITLDTTHIPAIDNCCNAHDRCYHTCNNDKNDCDDEFRECLTKLCRSVKQHVSKEVYTGCKSVADLMYAGTMTLGCKPYKESQEDACYCPQRKTRRNEL